MQFGERLKQLRKARRMTQDDAARELGMGKSTIQKYEAGIMYPRNSKVYQKIGAVFGIEPAYLLSEEDHYIIAASERGGYKGKRDVQTLITEVGAMFAGGELSEDDKDKVLRTINELYWIAKDKNKKHEPNKKEKE